MCWKYYANSAISANSSLKRLPTALSSAYQTRHISYHLVGISRHTQRQSIPSKSIINLRSFHTTWFNHAVYKRFEDPERKTTPLPIVRSSRKENYGQWKVNYNPPNFTYLPPWLWLLGAAGGFYYLDHLEKVELTGRWRFMDTSVESEIETGEQVYIQTLSQFQSKLLHPAHPTSVFITGVAHKIIRASQLSSRDPAQLVEHSSDNDHLNLPNATTSSHMGLLSNWKIHVIDDPKIQNAFVIPGGKIFVFTGILPICQNEAGLATVLGHEVAHQVLRHPAERMSSMKVIFLLTTMLQVLGLDPALCRAAVTLLMTLPNSRRSEIEADQVGLSIMASACFDPKEAVGVWKRMDEHERSSRIARMATEFLQTHPTHGSRIEKIVSWLPEAQSHRDRNCGFTTRAFHQFVNWDS
ncbi:hypothetical protein PCASD_18411 [Puccinia coronata f. sp. avenae]|uniref:Peptidase M48 domain-containing protein n=1 Tax=Puccinia coronata f. sp. avenae TaxID=200324 RepID=A0A2N5TTI9_9BASI|nr:hypothetical protein PCASD_22840 [Puccinia coronata f. sp. avenae]PLW28802.1 hypothetical protein PCASD_18411 [Puccinia coronata f. sp. avenae]